MRREIPNDSEGTETDGKMLDEEKWPKGTSGRCMAYMYKRSGSTLCAGGGIRWGVMRRNETVCVRESERQDVPRIVYCEMVRFFPVDYH